MSDIPSSCPGVQSENAGKSDGCKGCPNQSACSSGQVNTGPDPDLEEIAKRLATVKNIILVLSGKGGVGKSTVASSLARAFSRDESLNVGVLDIDICGPSLPRMMGLENEQIHMSSTGWSPVYVLDNLSVMSCGFLLESLDDAVIWRGPKKNGLIKQFLRDVDWGDVDYLIIDTPPGTSDEHLSIVQYLKSLQNLRGAVLVSTPQEAALLDVKKQIDFCKRVGLPIVGLVENMSDFVCPGCKHQSKIFPPTTGGVTQLANEHHVPFLGSIPLDPLIGKASDKGEAYFEAKELSASVKAMDNVMTKVKHVIDKLFK